MGCCMSDVRGGKEAIGGGPTTSAAKEVNDAVDNFLRSKGLSGLVTQLEISLSASKLLDLDVLSKSDPMAVMYQKKQDGKLEELGRTEVMLNSLDPVWITKLNVSYQFETVQQLVFRVYDIDTNFHSTPVKMLKLNDQDFLGEASCSLSEIVTKQNCSVTLDLQSKSGNSKGRIGKLTVHAEESIASKKVVEMIFRCTNLQNKDAFSKSDPFLKISRIVEGGRIIPICKTEVIDNNLNPVWRPVTLTTQQYASKDTPLIIECFDFNSDGNHDTLGNIQTSLANLEDLHMKRTGVNLYSGRLNQQKRKMLRGQLFVDKFTERTQYTFLDYIASGFELNFMVAVDFTASNGKPELPTSLHYMDPSGRLNCYQQAIAGVADVIQFYDSDRRFPSWGFGGKLPDGSVSHCFNLNGYPDNSEVVGVEGIMAAYATALHTITLFGPTLFAPVIRRAAEIATNSLNYSRNKYFVLLILTDGAINDFQETIDALVKASDLPLSFLIVGVGNADFKNMEVLDADNGKRLQSSTGRIATRDVVQFMPMRDVQGDASIAQLLLEELPGQFLSYMRARDVKPLYAQHGLTPN